MVMHMKVKEEIPETNEKKTSGIISIFNKLINIAPPKLKIYLEKKSDITYKTLNKNFGRYSSGIY